MWIFDIKDFIESYFFMGFITQQKVLIFGQAHAEI